MIGATAPTLTSSTQRIQSQNFQKNFLWNHMLTVMQNDATVMSVKQPLKISFTHGICLLIMYFSSC